MNQRHRCTAEQAAHRLGVPVGTVCRLVAAGILPSTGEAGTGPILSVADVERYANSRRRVGIR